MAIWFWIILSKLTTCWSLLEYFYQQFRSFSVYFSIRSTMDQGLKEFVLFINLSIRIFTHSNVCSEISLFIFLLVYFFQLGHSFLLLLGLWKEECQLIVILLGITKIVFGILGLQLQLQVLET